MAHEAEPARFIQSLVVAATGWLSCAFFLLKK
jgi:hypothetical protein